MAKPKEKKTYTWAVELRCVPRIVVGSKGFDRKTAEQNVRMLNDLLHQLGLDSDAFFELHLVSVLGSETR